MMNFFNSHQAFIENNPKGYGFFIWKPYVIYKILKQLDEGDILVWGDAGNTMQLHDLNVGHFAIDYLISPNGVTSNADIILMENIRCGDARPGISGGQAQEKGNLIRGLYSWGRIHTIFATNLYGKCQAGNYTIDGGNIAGKPIRLIYNPESGWFPTHISNLFCESLGTIGTITSGDSNNNLPTSISNCVFDFAYVSQAGVQTLFTSNSPFIKFENCLFRYYGAYSDTLHFKGLPLLRIAVSAGL